MLAHRSWLMQPPHDRHGLGLQRAHNRPAPNCVRDNAIKIARESGERFMSRPNERVDDERDAFGLEFLPERSILRGHDQSENAVLLTPARGVKKHYWRAGQ